MKMTNEDYLMTQMQLEAFEQVLTHMPLEEFIERARHADTVGAILDPTLYREASGKLHHVIAVAEALNDAKSRIMRSEKRFATSERIAQ